MFYQMTRFLLNCSTGYPDSIGSEPKDGMMKAPSSELGKPNGGIKKPHAGG